MPTLEFDNLIPQKHQICYEGKNLNELLKLIEREIESARKLDTLLPYKIWLKSQFSIGVNDVTRVLERMPPVAGTPEQHSLKDSGCSSSKNHHDRAASTTLQVILVAADCNPRWLTKHLPIMASSRNVPIISVKDNKEGSLRLGGLVQLKTAIAIGVKARGNPINSFFEKILENNEV